MNDGGKGEEVKKEEVGHLVLHLVTTQTAVGPVPDDGSGCQLVQHLTHAHTVICNTIIYIHLTHAHTVICNTILGIYIY